MNEATLKVIAQLLEYSFSPIGWEYKHLTGNEKLIVTREQFNEIKEFVEKTLDTSITC